MASTAEPRAGIRRLQALKLRLEGDADSSDVMLKSTKQIPDRADRKRKKERPLKGKGPTTKGNAGGGGSVEPGKERKDADRPANSQRQGIHDAVTATLASSRHRKQILVLNGEPYPGKDRSMAAAAGDAYTKTTRKKTGVKGLNTVQRRRLHVEMLATETASATLSMKKLEPPVDPAKAKAAAMRQRRMRKLRARRKATGEYDRLVAVKLKRHNSSEASRLQRNLREQMRRSDKRPAAIGADMQISDGDKTRPQPPSLSTEETKYKKRILERQHRAATKANNKLASTTSIPTTSGLRNSTPILCDIEQRRRRRDEALHILRTKRQIVHGENAGPDRKRHEPPHMGEGPPCRRDEIDVGHEACPSGEVKIDVKVEGVGVGLLNDLSTSCPHSDIQQQLPLKEEPWPGAAAEADVMEEGQVSPIIFGEPVKRPDNGTEQTDPKNDLPLDMMPIPRKTTSNNTTSASSFVIPKRSTNNSAGHTEATLVPRTNDDRKQLERLGVEVPPGSSLASPQLSNRDPIRTPRKRSKNVVPVKISIFSPQERTLMRLARKRNSILSAAAEIEPDAALSASTKAHMAGYEVYGVDGKVLSDLVPRWSCATKCKVTSTKELIPASYFGVSLCAPVAEGNAESTFDEYINAERRRVHCYEELRFERPEDREFYQRRMYGTTFVPQQLRGWTTLIIRRVRFERKSTGIRFNQGRDREEFAASLSKRYSFNGSVPRCNIPRENWLNLMKSQPSTAYLHYRNREDAERASHMFRDDYGNLLEMKLEYKAGVTISRRSSPADGDRSKETPRSNPSEHSAHEPSRAGSPRTTPQCKQEYQSVTNNDHPFSRYDQPPSASEEDREVGSPICGYMCPRALLRRRSRSRSRSHSRPKAPLSQDQTNISAACGTDDIAQAASLSFSETMNETRENGKEIETIGMDGSIRDSKNDEAGDLNSQARAASPTAPLSTGATENMSTSRIESDEEEQEEGEIDSRTVPMTSATWRDERERRWSPPMRWQQVRREEAGYYADSREPGGGYNPYQYNRGPDRRRSRSRSRPRDAWCEPGHGGGWGGSYIDDRRHFRGFDNHCDDSGYGRRMLWDEVGRNGGRDYRDEGYNSRGADAYSRHY
ncbi:hypothetical protein ON010_g10522 [Phytophthora cinnamomi]|nr:hypothetical protein ON010_g10522 [Phytophthora cinnamomi]